MSEGVSDNEDRHPHIGRSMVALLAGIVAGIVFTLGTDIVHHAIGVFPPLGQWTPSRPLLLATAYRTVYGVLSGYIIARLAPDRPMAHALIGGMVTLVVSIVGAVATWNRGLGPHWYPLALIVLAMPSAWAGGRLRVRQLRA